VQRQLASVPHPDDYTSVRHTRANAHVAAFGVMSAPIAVMFVADDNRGIARAQNDFSGSGKGSHYRRGNRSAQNKHSHLGSP